MSDNTPGTEVELVDKRDIATQMLAGGVSEVDVATILRMPIHTVQEVQSVRTKTTMLSVADTEIAEAMRNLIWIAYEEAVYRIQYGSPNDRMALIKLILAGGMRLVGVEQSTRFDEMRAVFEGMMSGIRTPESDRDIPFDDDVGSSHAETLAALGDLNNPD